MFMEDRGRPGMSWAFTNATSAGLHLLAFGLQQSMQPTVGQKLTLSAKTSEANTAKFVLRDPVGSYPEGAKLLKGVDKSYVLAPVGHIIEEKYSPYLEFRA